MTTVPPQPDVNSTAASLSFHRRTNPDLSALELAQWAETNLGLSVETGLAMNTNRDPVPHAWNATEDGTVIDGSAHLLGHVDPVTVLGRDKRGAQYIPDVHTAAHVPSSPAPRHEPILPAPTPTLEGGLAEPDTLDPVRVTGPAPAVEPQPVAPHREFDDIELFAPRTEEPAPWDDDTEPVSEPRDDTPEPDTELEDEPAPETRPRRSPKNKKQAQPKPVRRRRRPGVFALKLVLTCCVVLVAVSATLHITGYARFVTMAETDAPAFAAYPAGTLIVSVTADPNDLVYGDVILVEDGDSEIIRTFSTTTETGFVSMDGNLAAASRTEHTGDVWKAESGVPTVGRLVSHLNGYGTYLLAGAAALACVALLATTRTKKD